VYKNVSFSKSTANHYFAYGASGGNPVLPTLSVFDGDNSLELDGKIVDTGGNGGGDDGFLAFPKGEWVALQAGLIDYVSSEASESIYRPTLSGASFIHNCLEFQSE
jgi:hypothetical protein